MAKKRKKMNEWLKFENIRSFYLGFLASIGVFAFSYFIVFMLLSLLKITSSNANFKIIFSIFYLFVLIYTYSIIRKEKYLTWGFLSTAIVIIWWHISLWVF